MKEEKEQASRETRGLNRIPSGSLFYEKVVPAILIVLAIITALLILVAIGVLLGLIP
ncbi:MAG: hypothetical protein ACE5MB_02525 [Anaerolineae bacterium]